ncbi:hypothetical protein TcCL_NonESM12671 [Trypanosoma cruzi]|nr:hypothetical protein TcCL_Unassigned01825 [Trypanosoma cruzi]RNC38118.1 hypothetical protein TcCL_NonESM12671 [Trypanosoma cruzi]
MYRCHPSVPLAVLMCLPVLLLFFPFLQHTPTQVFAKCNAGMFWRRRDVGLHPVLTWRGRCVCACAVGITAPLDGGVWDAFCIEFVAGLRGCMMPAMHEGVACSWGHSSPLCFCFAGCGCCSACAGA